QRKSGPDSRIADAVSKFRLSSHGLQPRPQESKLRRRAGQKLPDTRALVGGAGGSRGSDADEAPAASAVFKLDVSSDQREQRVVLALAYIVASLMLGASLANQDGAGINQLAAETLYAQPLAVRIAAVC